MMLLGACLFSVHWNTPSPCTQRKGLIRCEGKSSLHRDLAQTIVKSPCCHLKFIFSTGFLIKEAHTSLIVDCSSLRVLFVRHLKEHQLRGSSYKRSPYKCDHKDEEIWTQLQPHFEQLKHVFKVTSSCFHRSHRPRGLYFRDPVTLRQTGGYVSSIPPYVNTVCSFLLQVRRPSILLNTSKLLRP